MTNKSRIECSYIPLTETNLHWFIPLYKAAFQKDVTLDEVKKKYDFSLMNKPYLGLFACYDNKPIGFIGICYYLSQYNGTIELASNFTDSMVHPDFQGKNIYVPLLDKLKEVAKENGICFSLGFPNDNSFYPVVHKGKWLIAINMIGFIVKAKSLPVAKVVRKMGLEKRYLRWCKQKLKRLVVDYNPDAFKENVSSFHIVHDQNFFLYKQTPAHFLLKIEDAYVWIKIDGKLSVGFIGELEEQQMLKVINKLIKIAKSLFLDKIVLQFTKNTVQDKILRKHFEWFESWPVLYSNQQSMFPYEKMQLQYCDVDSF